MRACHGPCSSRPAVKQTPLHLRPGQGPCQSRPVWPSPPPAPRWGVHGMKSLLRSPPLPPLAGGGRRPRRLRPRRGGLLCCISPAPPWLSCPTSRSPASMLNRDPPGPPAAVPAAPPPAAVLLLLVRSPAAAVVPAIRNFRMVHPPAAAVIPPLPQKGRPVPRCRTVTALTRAMVGMPASDPLTSRRPCTMQAGGTSLYRSAAILPRPGHRGGRPDPEELTLPPAPLRGGLPPGRVGSGSRSLRSLLPSAGPPRPLD